MKEVSAEIKDFFDDYNGCRNCKHENEYEMCQLGKHYTDKLICPGWEKNGRKGAQP